MGLHKQVLNVGICIVTYLAMGYALSCSCGNIEESRTVECECATSSSDVEWFYKDIRVSTCFASAVLCLPSTPSNGNGASFIVTEDVYKISITNFSLVDCRQYMCKYSFTSDRISLPYCPVLTMTKPYHDNQLNILESTTEEFICSFRSSPAGTVEWYTDSGSPTDPSDDVNITHASRSVQASTDNDEYIVTSTLRLTPSRAYTGNRIYCKATNKPEQTPLISQRMPLLNIMYSPRIDKMTDTTLDEDAVLNVTCPVQYSNPSDTNIVWTRSTDTHTWSGEQLYIESVTESDNGTYICTASNVMITNDGNVHNGFDQQSLNLQVLLKPKIIAFQVAGFDGKDIVILDEGTDATIQCNVDSEPTSKVTLTFPTGYVYYNTLTMLSYTLHNVECQDSGTYLCTANNRDNKEIAAYKTILILVKCSPRPAVNVDSNVTALENEVATFTFKTIAYPFPSFMWSKFFDNLWTDISTDNSNIKVSTKQLETTLTISNVNEHDYGAYKLAVTNVIGNQEHMFYLIKPEIPEVPLKFRSIQTTQSSITLAWEPGFDGGLQQVFEIKYKIVSSQLWSIDSILDTKKSDMNHTLNGLSADTQYEIIMYAVSKIGRSQTPKLTISTKATETSLGAGVVIGVAFGGFVVGVIFCGVVICSVFVIRRRISCLKSTQKKTSVEKDMTHAETTTTEVDATNNMDTETEGPSEYEYIGDRVPGGDYTVLAPGQGGAGLPETYENLQLAPIIT